MPHDKGNDIHISVPMIEPDKLAIFEHKPGESSEVIRKRVMGARDIQNKRFKKAGIFSNSGMKNKHIKEFCKIEKESLLLLKQAVNNYGLSARTYFRLIKVSQTIADLAGDASIMQNHVAEALQYRIRESE